MPTDRELRYDGTQNRLLEYREADDSWQPVYRQLEEFVLRHWGQDVSGVVFTPELVRNFQDWIRGGQESPPSLEDVKEEQGTAALLGGRTELPTTAPPAETDQVPTYGLMDWAQPGKWWDKLGGGTAWDDEAPPPEAAPVEAAPNVPNVPNVPSVSGDTPSYGDLTVGPAGDVWVYGIDKNGQDNFIKMRELEEEVGEYTFAQYADLILASYTDGEGETDEIEGLNFFLRKDTLDDLLEDDEEVIPWTQADATAKASASATREPLADDTDWYDELRTQKQWAHLPVDRSELSQVPNYTAIIEGQPPIFDGTYRTDWDAMLKILEGFRVVAKNLGIEVGDEVVEEEPWTGDVARKAAEAAGPGFMHDYTPEKRWFMRRRTVDDPYDTEAEADAGAKAQGYTNYEIVPNPDGRGVVISIGAAGKKYFSSQAAEDDKPEGMRVIPLTQTDGSILYGYDYAPKEPKRVIDTWDEVIIDAYDKGGAPAAIEADQLRDRIEAKAITPLEALDFAWKVAEDPNQFMEIADLVMRLGSQQGVTSAFTSATQVGASAIGQDKSPDDFMRDLEQTPATKDEFSDLYNQMLEAPTDVGFESTEGADLPTDAATTDAATTVPAGVLPGFDVLEGETAAPGEIEQDLAAREEARARWAAWNRAAIRGENVETEIESLARERAEARVRELIGDDDEPGEEDRLYGIFIEEEREGARKELGQANIAEQKAQQKQLDPSQQPPGYTFTAEDGTHLEVQENGRVLITYATGGTFETSAVPKWAWPKKVGGKDVAADAAAATDTSYGPTVAYEGQPTPRPSEFDMTAFEETKSRLSEIQEAQRKSKRYRELPGVTAGTTGKRGAGI